MTPGMETALGGMQVMLAGLLQISLPGHTIRLCDGSAAIVFDGHVFTGKDDIYGTIGEVESISEATGDTIPGLDIALLPPDLAGAVLFTNPANQDAPVRVWLAVVDPVTGLVIPDPELLFAGEIDVAWLDVDRGTIKVPIKVASVFERLREPDEGVRLSDAFHQSICPGELGMSNMSGTPVERLWGPGDKNTASSSVPQSVVGAFSRWIRAQ